MEIVTKAAAIVENSETDNPNGAFDVVLSAATLDRDGEVIDSRAFDPLPDHIPFDIDHGMTVQTTVGSGTPYYDDNGSLRVKGTYASTPLAQEVRTLVAEGHIRTTSVTFMSATREADEKGVNHVKTAELLNGTFTPIPSNRQAVVLSAKGMAAVTEEKVGARNSAGDASTIQGMHDSSVSLGASCAAKSVKTATLAPEIPEVTEADVEAALNPLMRAFLADVRAQQVAATEADESPEVSDTEQSADEAASDSAADEAAETDTAESADEGSDTEARWASEVAIFSKEFGD